MKIRMHILGTVALLMAAVPGFWLVQAQSTITPTTPMSRVTDALEPPWMHLIRLLPQSRPGKPVSLLIPSLKINASIENLVLDTKGVMETPREWNNIGWYELGPRAGENGNAVFAGHLDSKTGPAVFWHLKKLKPQDVIFVTDDAGTARRFLVRETKTYEASDAPLQEIFSKEGRPQIVLITCTGTWSDSVGAYAERYAVFAEEG